MSLWWIFTLVFAGAVTAVLAALGVVCRRDHAALAALNIELEARITAAVALSEKAMIRNKRAKRLRALGQVAGGVAHEFNNILQATTGGLEMIKRRPADTERVLRLTDLALTATARGSVLTRRLLTFARRAPLHATAVDVSAVLTALREPLTRMASERIVVSVALEAGLPAVFVDRTEMETAVINLVANARDAMPAGGTLAIAATAVVINGVANPRTTLGPGRYVRIAIRDTGTGMTPEILARAEEPFFTTKEIGFGTGLGLSMAKGFAEQSGGGLVIESAPDAGTTVTVWLPANGDHA